MSYSQDNRQKEIEQFDVALQAFTVADIASKAYVIPPKSSVSYAFFEVLFEFEEYVLVKDKNQCYGYLDPCNWDMDRFSEVHNVDIYDDKVAEKVMVKDIAKPITHDLIIPQNLPLSKIQDYSKLDKGYFLLGNESIDEIITFYDLDKLPAKLGLFTILLEIESKMTYILRNAPNLDAYLNMLPASFMKKVRSYANQKKKESNEIGPLEMLSYTNLKEKYLMIREHFLKLENDEKEYVKILDKYFGNCLGLA
jgi:hypothetical protein